MNGKVKARITGISGGLLAAALLLHLAGLPMATNIILFAASLTAGFPILLKSIQSLKMKTFSIELLVSIAVIGALFIGEYTEAAVVSFLFLFGAYLEARTLEKTRSSLKLLMDMAPKVATVLREGAKKVISADEIRKGDRVFIQSGEKVAIDGKVLTGTAYINEAAITGESVPAPKTPGDQVFSGTIIDHGYIEVEAEKIGDDTAFARIVEMIEDAQEKKTKTEKFLERFASFYTPAIVILSLIVYIFTKNIEFTLTFLVIACPGALVISAPVSIVAGIGNGAKNGVLIKGGESMERLAKIDVAVFDKTGTLTRGKPEVAAIRTFGIGEDRLLALAASAETASEHPLGQTIIREAKERNIAIAEPERVKIGKGGGIEADVAGEKIRLGNRGWMERANVIIPIDAETYAEGQERLGSTAIFMAVQGKLAGIIAIADQVRPEAAEAIAAIRKAGVKKVYMLTGDNRHTAALVASRLGIDHVEAELLPEEKLAKVEELTRQGFHVAMAGDGINDAPAIAAADIGIAMGGTGTDVSMETADVVLMAGNMNGLAHALTLAKATVRNMKGNTIFAVGTVILLLAGVLMQKVFLAAGMFIHEASVLLVILNAIRLVRFSSRNKKTKGRARLEGLRTS